MKTSHIILPLAVSFLLPQLAAAQQIEPIFIYPEEGQSQDQLEKDQSECEMWTFQQIGFPTWYVPPGDAGAGKTSKNAAIGTVAGAGIGAAAGAVGGSAGKGAAAGAAAGLIGGLIIGSKKKKHAREEAQAQSQASNQVYNDNYKRAMTACLSARDYSVN